MIRWFYLLALATLILIVAMSCSNGINPIQPSQSSLTTGQSIENTPSQTQLWGYYDVSIDTSTKTASAVLNRHATFSANVINFINKSPAALSFMVNSVAPGTGFTDVDIDVKITHPFPGMPQYNGYDVRGIFMGDGSGSMAYNSDLKYAVLGTDQSMLPSPVDGFGAPDGYTRWFNKPEFSQPGLPLFQYTQGKYASTGFNGTATLNPYKYFADSLGTTDDLYTWLGAHAGQSGVFSSGATNDRNYYLRFPDSKGVTFGYAIVANWEGTDPGSHPSNALEALGCAIDDQSTVYYIDGTNKGGSLIFDISLFDWHGQPSAIFVESTVLSSPHQLSPGEMVPVGGDSNSSTWHVEIAADNIIGVDGNEYWIIAQYISTYENGLGTPNLAGTDPLAAFFRHDLHVSADNQAPVCDIQAVTPLPAKGWDVGTPVQFDASGSTDPGGRSLTFAWDFNGDGTFDDPEDTYTGSPDKPTHIYTADYSGQVCVKVSSGSGGTSTCCIDAPVDVFPSKNIPLRDGVTAYDIAIDPVDGDLLVLYSDGEIWQYLITDFYQFGSKLHDLNVDFGTIQPLTGCKLMDVAGNSAISIAGVTEGAYIQNRVAYYKADGSPIPEKIYPAWPWKLIDAVAYQDVSLHANGGGCLMGYDADYISSNVQSVLWFPAPSYNSTHYTDNMLGYASPTTGPTVIYWPYMVAGETDANGDYLWILQNTNYYASRWEAQGTGTYGTLVYNNANFGTGSQTDSDNGWYNGLDITMDNQGRCFVLDLLSTGGPRIKMWTISGNTTTSEGGFGDSGSISSTPLRIEGSTFGEEVVVLHGTTSPYMISVFLASEMP